MGESALQYNEFGYVTYYCDPNASTDHSVATRGSLSYYMQKIAGEAVGGVVQLLPGTFPILSKLDQFSQGLSIQGCGMSSIIERANQTEGDPDDYRIIECNGHDQINLRNFQVTGVSSLLNTAPYYSSEGSSVYIANSLSSSIEHIYSYQLPNRAIYVHNCDGIRVNDCHIESCKTGCIYVVNSNNVQIYRNVVSRTPSNARAWPDCTHGSIVTDNCYKPKLYGNYASSSDSEGTIIGVFGCQDGAIQRNFAYGVSGGGSAGGGMVDLFSSIDFNCIGNQIFSNGAGGHGIWVFTAGGHLIKNNLLKDIPGTAILLNTLVFPWPFNCHASHNITTGTIGTNINMGSGSPNYSSEWGQYVA